MSSGFKLTSIVLMLITFAACQPAQFRYAGNPLRNAESDPPPNTISETEEDTASGIEEASEESPEGTEEQPEPTDTDETADSSDPPDSYPENNTDPEPQPAEANCTPDNCPIDGTWKLLTFVCENAATAVRYYYQMELIFNGTEGREKTFSENPFGRCEANQNLSAVNVGGSYDLSYVADPATCAGCPTWPPCNDPGGEVNVSASINPRGLLVIETYDFDLCPGPKATLYFKKK